MTRGHDLGWLLATLVVVVGGTLLLRRDLGAARALVVSTLKAFVPLLWFLFLDDGSIRLVDDVGYTRDALLLLSQIDSPLDLLSLDRLQLVVILFGGRHIGYYLLTALSFGMFGEHYASPIFLNVLLTIAAARGMGALLRDADVSPAYRRGFVLFFLFHWDVIAWSSFFSLKDPLVMALSVGVLVNARRAVGRRALRALLLALLFSFLLFYVRWYLVPFLWAIVGAWVGLTLRGIPRLLLLAAVAGGTFAVLRTTQIPSRFLVFDDAAYGFLRFLTTPRPWGTTFTYRFLQWPAALHWLSLPLATIGFASLWARSREARLVLLYLVAILCLYAVLPHLQGPRHRFQAVFALALCQFQGLWWFLCSVRDTARAEPDRAPVAA